MLHFVARHVADKVDRRVGRFATGVDIQRVSLRRDHRSHRQSGRADDRQHRNRRVDLGVLQIVGPAPVAVDDHRGPARLEQRVRQLIVAASRHHAMLVAERLDEAVGGDRLGRIKGRHRRSRFRLLKHPGTIAGEKRDRKKRLGKIPDQAVAVAAAVAILVNRVFDRQPHQLVGRFRRRLDEAAVVHQRQMIPEPIAHLHQLALRRFFERGQISQCSVDELLSRARREPRREVLDQSHRVKSVEHVGGPVDQLRAGAGQRRRLEAAPQFFGLLVQRPDADVGVNRLVSGNFLAEQLPLRGTDLVPHRDHEALVVRLAAAQESQQ